MERLNSENFGLKKYCAFYSPIDQAERLIPIDVDAEVFERANELLQVHFSVAILVQVREL